MVPFPKTKAVLGKIITHHQGASTRSARRPADCRLSKEIITILPQGTDPHTAHYDTSSKLSQTGGENTGKPKKKKKVKNHDKNFPYLTPLICQLPGVGQASLSPQAVTRNLI